MAEEAAHHGGVGKESPSRYRLVSRSYFQLMIPAHHPAKCSGAGRRTPASGLRQLWICLYKITQGNCFELTLKGN